MRRQDLVLMGLVLFCSLAIRWYKLPQYLFFGFEQGRDLTRVAQIARLEDILLVGPKTDITGIFHGVWYYYFLVPLYFLGSGDPLWYSFGLVLASSLVPVTVYFLLKKETQRWEIALFGAILAASSFELISYSRWLSNVTLALPLISLLFCSLLLYSQEKRPVFLILSASLAGLAAQFEIILTLWFLAFFSFLFITKTLTLPKLKSAIVAFVAYVFWYLPFILFNLRHNFISVQAGLQHVREPSSKVPLNSTLLNYGQMLWRQFAYSSIHFNMGLSLFVLSGTIVGLIFYIRQHKNSPLLLIALSFCFASLPALFFPESVKLVQLYVGAGLASIILISLALAGWTQKPKLAPFIFCTFLALWLTQSLQNFLLLDKNLGAFFVTIQDDLNYHDQQELLNFIHSDIGDTAYSLKAITIPYYHEEAWHYLQQYMLQTGVEADANILYVIIEKPVDPKWETNLLNELGSKTLIWEKSFGKIRLQKYQRPAAESS